MKCSVYRQGNSIYVTQSCPDGSLPELLATGARLLNHSLTPVPKKWSLYRNINPVLYHPIVPEHTTAWAPARKLGRSKARGLLKRPIGAVRSFYNPANKNVFDVAYHDPSAGKTSGGTDRFKMAKNVPKAVPPPTCSKCQSILQGGKCLDASCGAYTGSKKVSV